MNSVGTDRHSDGATFRALAFGIFAIGAGLRLVQYGSNTSLGLDEIAVIEGIRNSTCLDLLSRPLPFDQAAPAGFLLIQKGVLTLFGSRDFVLRLYPFTWSLVGMALFWRVSRHMLPRAGTIVAMLLFATAAPLISYAGIVKQYSSDAGIAVAFLWLACRLTTTPISRSQAWQAAAGGAALVWLSHPAVLTVGALALPVAWWIQAERENDRPRFAVMVAGAWAASALALTLVSLAAQTPATRHYLQTYWATGFSPAPLFPLTLEQWPWRNVRDLIGSGLSQATLAYPYPALYAMLALIGLGGMWRNARRTAVLLTAPLVVALAAAVAMQYPFVDRFLLFLIPSLLLAIGAAVGALYDLIAPYSRPLAAVSASGLTLAALSPVALAPPPYRIEHIKPVLAHVRSERLAGDAIYVYYGAAPGVHAYAAQFGFSRADYAVGGCHRGETLRYLEELDFFRGRARVWVLVTHSQPHYREREDMLSYLDAIGTRLQHVSIPSYAIRISAGPAEAFLYDLSSPSKLSRASAGSFQATGVPASEWQACRNGPQVMIGPDFSCGPAGSPCFMRTDQ